MLKRWLAIAFFLSARLAMADVELNLANEADLDGLKGIGPATSARILAERQRSPFKDWADLIARVKGIGPQLATRLSNDGLRVNGGAFELIEKSAKIKRDSP